MPPKRKAYNPKRSFAQAPDPAALARLADSARYGGNPEHKRHPGDFGLTPPSSPRPDKSLCDGAGVLRRADAQRYLQAGIRAGLISEQQRNGFPQNVWAVADSGVPLEAQLENPVLGVYHGYPMPEADPFRDAVIRRWRDAHGP